MIAALDARFRAPAPPERLATLRILVGGFALVYLVVRAVYFNSYGYFRPEQFRPAGPVAILNAPLPFWAVLSIYTGSVLAGIAFVAGYKYRLSGPLFLAGFTWVTAYRSSWGMLLHHENLIVVQLAVLAFVRAADAYALDARTPKPASPDHGWPVRLLMFATATAYFIAAIAKIRNTGWDWALGDELRLHVAYDALRKLSVGHVHSPLGAWLVGVPWVFPPLALVSFAAELLGPALVFHTRARQVWAIAIWGFHWGVVALMMITFVFNLSFIPFACFWHVEKLWPWLRARVAKRMEPAPGIG